MDDARSLCHARWECKYHVVWIPKGGKKTLYGNLRKHLGDVLRELARRGECETHLLHHVFAVLCAARGYGFARPAWHHTRDTPAHDFDVRHLQPSTRLTVGGAAIPSAWNTFPVTPTNSVRSR